jgi:hypothetical protein
MARMRTIADTYAYLKKQDPETAITMHALRKMVLTNEIPTVKAGCKSLINLDALEKHLEYPLHKAELNIPVQSANGIRKLME